MRTPSVLLVAAPFVMLALLPVTAALSASPIDLPLQSAVAQPIAVVSATLRSAKPGTSPSSDAATITIVGIGLLGLAAMVRKGTGENKRTGT